MFVSEIIRKNRLPIFLTRTYLSDLDQLHDDWNRYISPISSETRRNDVMLEKMYNRFASFISTFKHTVTEGLPFEVEIYIDGSLWEEDYDFTEDDYIL